MSYFKKFFQDKKYIKLIVIMAIPVALQNLLSALLNVLDGVMVSFLANSDQKMAAVLICNKIIFIFSLLIFAIASTSSVLTSQYYGKKDLSKVHKCVGIAMIISLGVALLFTFAGLFFSEHLVKLFSSDPDVITYGAEFMKIVCWSFVPFAISSVFIISLRGIRKVSIGFYVLALGVSVNFFFNYVFMFGKLGFPNMDLAGAAVGTIISRCAELIFVIIICLVKKYPVIASPLKMFRLEKELFSKSIKIMLPATANELFWVLGTTVYIAAFGRVNNSTAVQAALNIVDNVDRLFFVFLAGIGISTSILVGNELGAMEMDKARESGEKSIVFALIIGVSVAALMALSILFVPYLYKNVSSETLALSKNLIIVFAVSMIIRSINFTLGIGILRGGGDTRFIFFVELITIWVIAVPLCLVAALVFKLSPDIVYILIFSEELVKAFLFLARFKTTRWQKNLVGEV